MISVIVCWLFAAFVFLSFGDFTIRLYHKIIQKEEDTYSFFETFIVGLCIVGSIIGLCSLWIPSNLNLLIVLTLSAVIYLLISTKRRKISYKGLFQGGGLQLTSYQLFTITFSLLLFTVFVVMPPQLPDTYYYHIQNMLWNESYPVVPGLANLIEQFGFNSNFFLLSSTFGLKPLFGQYIYGLNALCMALFLIQVIINANNKQVFYLTCISLLIFSLLFMEYKIHIGSPSTDVLPNLLISYLFISVLSSQKNIINKSLLFWLIPVFCITLKLSTAFVCLFCIYLLIYFIKQKAYRDIVALSLLSLFVVVPWLCRNVITSGYLVYPLYSIDLFEVDWKLPLEYVVASKNYIEAYAISELALDEPTSFIFGLSFGDKVKYWLHEQSYLDIILVASTFMSSFLMFFLYIRKKRMKQDLVLFFTWLIAFVAFLICFKTAPAVRFTIGFMLILIFTPIYLFIRNNKYRHKLLTNNLLIGISLLFLTVLTVRYFFSIKEPLEPYSTILCNPQGREDVFTKESQLINYTQLNNFQLFKPVKWIYFDCELPCKTQPTQTTQALEMRGNSLQDGFRTPKTE